MNILWKDVSGACFEVLRGQVPAEPGMYLKYGTGCYTVDSHFKLHPVATRD